MSTLEPCFDSHCAGWVQSSLRIILDKYIETRTEADKQVQSAALNTESVYFRREPSHNLVLKSRCTESVN